MDSSDSDSSSNMNRELIVEVSKKQREAESTSKFLINSPSKRSGRRRTVSDAGHSNFDENLRKMRSIDVPNRKRAADDELHGFAKRLRKITFSDVSQPGLNRDAVDQESYDASGLKRSLHGTVYQLKHLMLVVHRAWKMGCSFRLATEMDAAEKFDDVVLRYTDSNGDEVYRFLQAKHKQDGTKAISARDLLDVNDGDFSLQKYFGSWRKIKKRPDFSGSGSKNFILCTNIGLEVEGLKKENICVSDVTEPDDFLKVTNGKKQPPRYKLRVKNGSGLWKTLELASDVHRLARELAKCILGDQEIQLRTDIFKSYHVALAEEVIDVKRKKFSVNFVQNTTLSEKAAKFREILFLETNRLSPKKNQSEKCIWTRLEASSLKLSSTFGKKSELADQCAELPNDQVNDAEISCFLNEFILAVNQPNELELGEMMKREIGAYGQFSLPDAGFVRDSFQTEILDWFKTKQGRFLQEKDADDFFSEMEFRLCSLGTTTLSFEYFEKLKELGIRFNCGNEELWNFINCTNHTSDRARDRVLEIISPKQTLLPALQVCQILAQRQKCEETEDFIVIRLKTLLTPEIMKLVLRAFEWSGHHNLLVVDCQSITVKRHSQTLWNPLCDIMTKNNDKRMIVISQNGIALDTRFNLKCKYYLAKNLNHSFNNLTKDSQKKLLGKQVTKFQGQSTETSFGELLDIRDFDNVTEDELKDLSEILDSDSLVKLISDKEIQMGSDLKGLEEIGDYYISRTVCRRVVISKDIFDDKNIPNLLAVSGTSGKLPGKLVLMGNTSPITQIPANLTILKTDREEEEYKALCAENEDRNIHWLNMEKGEYIWKQSQGDITYLLEYRLDGESADSNDETGATYLSEDQLTAHDEPVIISDTAGMGKSTMLTQLACKMKEDDPDMLVVKIDLRHHVSALEKQEMKSSYDLDDINEAVRFLAKFSHETNLAQKVFRRIIERNHNVALIFDGFDEISPMYEGTVIHLLHTLARNGIRKLLVATRPHTKELLERKLNAFSYEIQPFSRVLQEEFFTKFWNAKFQDPGQDSDPDTEDRIQIYAAAIVEKLADSIDDRINKFTGNPQQAMLVAEIFEDHIELEREDFDSCKKFINSNADQPEFPERINLVYVYELFVKKKFNLYFKKRYCNLADPAVIEERDERYKKFTDIHKRLALDTLFDKEKIKELLHSQEDSSCRLPESIDPDIVVERRGLITQFIDDRPHFGHQTYAEYFAATFFSDMLKTCGKNESLRRIFVADILLEDNNKIIRAFVNLLLSSVHDNALSDESWRFYLNVHRNDRNESVFHVAAAEGGDHIIRLFSNCLNTNPRDRKALIRARDSFGKTAVRRAVEYGHLNGVRLLVENMEFEIDSKSGEGETSLHLAVLMGHWDIVKYFVHKGADINSRNMWGQTPLCDSVLVGELDNIQYLLKHRANVNLQDITGWSPLHAAASRNDTNVGRYLHVKGADINSQSLECETPLYVATLYGAVDIVKYLLEVKADINTRNIKGRSPLYVAAEKGELAIVEYLLNEGAEVTSQYTDGWSPLHAAAEGGKLDVVRCLLMDKRVNVNSQNNDGWTPLHLAARRGKLNVVEYLLDNGANINSQTHDGSWPLHLAAAASELGRVKYLHVNEANINSQTHDRSWLLHLATDAIGLDVVKYLHVNGANINSQRHDGLSPLHVAALQGYSEVEEYLLDNGANINSQTIDGWSALEAAVEGGHEDVLNYLLKVKGTGGISQYSYRNLGLGYGHGFNRQEIEIPESVRTFMRPSATIRDAHNMKRCLDVGEDFNWGVIEYDERKIFDQKISDPHPQNYNGWTPLQAAAYEGKLDVVTYLLEDGADVNSQNINGWSLLHLAAKGGQLDVVKHLLTEGADINSLDNVNFIPLHAAAYEGKLEVVIYLLENGANVNSKHRYGWTPLRLAAEGGKLAVVKHLVTEGADPNLEDDEGFMPLHVAAYHGNLNVVMFLLDNREANINSESNDGWLPLHAAVWKGGSDVVRRLLANGADVNSKMVDGGTLLQLAANGGNLDVVKCLLETGAEIDLKDDLGSTALHEAAQKNELDVVMYLLGEKANIDSQNTSGWSALHAAAHEGKVELVNLLIDRKANINIQDKDGLTPLHVASKAGKSDVITRLLDSGAKIDSEMNNGWTPLHLAASAGRLDVLKSFFDQGADINFQDSNRVTLLQVAAAEGQLNVAKYLLNIGADVDSQNKNGWSPLHVAAEGGRLDIVKCLLDKGAKINPQNINGWSPLHGAAQKGKLEVVTFLIVRKANINIQDNDGLTPLHVASRAGKLDVVMHLVENGADINSKDVNGSSPLHAAAQEGKLDIVMYFLENGADVNSQNNNGVTPLHSAKSAGRSDVIEYLLEKEANIDS